MKNILKISPKDMEKDMAKTYKACYHGLVENIRAIIGPVLPLYYVRETAFLSMFFMKLYDMDVSPYYLRRKRRYVIVNEASSYCANMNVIMIYLYSRYIGSARIAVNYRRVFNKAFLANPQKVDSLQELIDNIVDRETSFLANPEEIAADIGNIFSLIMAWREDKYAKDLSDIGYYFGKYLYYCVCYDTIDKRRKKGTYNPLSHMRYDDSEVFDTYILSNIKSLMDAMFSSLDKLSEEGDLAELTEIIKADITDNYLSLTKKNNLSKK